MRLVLIFAALALAACSSPERQRLEAACTSGNLQACAEVERIRQAALHNAGAAFGSLSANNQPIRQPVNCRWIGHIWQCL